MKKIEIDFDKSTKGVLVFSLFLVAFSLCYYYVFFLPQREEARLEMQRQEQLIKEEQEQKEYIAKRRMECYEIYEKEREKFSNLKSYRYVEICPKASFPDNLDFLFCENDSCEILYIDNETEEYFRKYF